MSGFAIASLVALALVVGCAQLVRGFPFSVFALVMLGVQTAIGAALFPLTGALWPLFALLHVTVYAHFLSLVWARPRPHVFRWGVSVPGHYFWAGTTLALPWAVAAAFGFSLPGLFIPYVIAGLGLLEVLVGKEETVDVLIDRVDSGGALTRAPLGGQSSRPLRIVQITDPHLGPFMSVERLAAISRRAVLAAPDLVLLTGDFLTMESQRDPEILRNALAPLSDLHGRVFACYGNHDLEAPATVQSALADNGIRLLVDEEALVHTDAGAVQLLGANFVWRDRAAHLGALTEQYPRRPDHLRVVLLHDPAAFAQLPEGEGDLVLSGHTHGGQLGLLRLGLATTVLSVFTSIPDHGFWSRGRDRLYVHRGTGHYGFPLRIGVPREESVVSVHWRR